MRMIQKVEYYQHDEFNMTVLRGLVGIHVE